MKSRRIPKHLTDRARALRSNPTPQERILWCLLSCYRPKFTRQLTIAPYTADLACRGAKLIVEIDGSQHIDSTHDEHRTQFLTAKGWTTIPKALRKRSCRRPPSASAAPTPNPSLSGRGECGGADLVNF
jgi:very-short-patch-repair endonuclease